jgi:phosphoglycerate dehydrogenase-like enzyme
MIGPCELALLPPGAVVINTARGGLLDFDAVHAARGAIRSPASRGTRTRPAAPPRAAWCG